MKKILTLLISMFLIASIKPAVAQQGTIDIGIIATECDQIIVQWNSTYSFVGSGQNGWTQSTFTLQWPSTYGADLLGTITPLTTGLTGWSYGTAALNAGFYTREVYMLVGEVRFQDVQIGVTDIISIKLDPASYSGTADITLVNPAGTTDISHFTFSGNMWSGTYNPSSVTGVPTANGIVWNGARWCGGTSAIYPGQPSSADQGINCLITGPNGVLNSVDAKVNTLTVNSGANLTIAPGASLTSFGAVNVNNPNGLNIDANTTSTGSFISRNATFNYGTGASSTVEQYFTDTVTTVPFHVHFVGPMVNDPSYQTANGHRGVYLGAFNLVNSSTFAYVYDNSQVTNPWVNVVPTTYPIPTTLGLALSTTTNTPQYLSQTGRLINGTINTGNGPSVVNTGYNLISNPYPSGIDLNSFLLVNYSINGDAGADVFAWEGANNGQGGNYSNYNYDSDIGTNGLASKIIRIGQGFFVDFIGGGNGTLSFALSQRVHSNNILLKSDPANILRLCARGNGFSDETVVLFKENGTPGFGFGDSQKWSSMYENATELWTETADQQLVAINTHAPLTSAVSVPMSFKCGVEGNYTLEAGTISSFELGTEIYLEDLKIGGEWHNLVLNPVYEFTGSPGDIQERFILHFFGPTAIDDPESGDEESAIQIYAWQQDAYIVNKGNETVKEYVAYDMMGRELHRGTLPNSTVNRVTIADVSGYYVVKVITKEGRIYTDKVYISK